MFKNIIKAFALVICLGALSNSAQAVTIDGQDYDKFLTVTVNDRLGYWVSMKKFYTYDNKPNSPVAANTTFKDAGLNGFDIGEVYAMGTSTSKSFDSNVNSGVVNLYDTSGGLLLGASYASNGTIDSTRAHGYAGQLDINGLFTLNSGKFHDLGLVNGPIYIEISFDKVVAIGGNDLHTTKGTINFYSRGGATEVPEPATVALLASSLFGAGRLRKKKAA